MAFLRSSIADPEAEIRGVKVYLRYPTMGDYAAWAELRAISRRHLTPWEPQWARDELTRSAYRRRLRQYQREVREDLGYAYLILREGDTTLLGGLTISNVRRGVSQSASLGYWMGAPHAGNGYMTDAVRAMLPYAFDTLALHRIEAACLPSNRASTRVLEKTGFQREGSARRYLKIDGVWRDHDLFALLHDDQRV
ncbi:MAG TPA: GNAT family protein [Hyphomicrobiaceae bacterium]|jgi:ribosomal-protein-alanine N-acetyltransferase|nr:GNAT family protein [Hyphomicrobiaceae bacterium]